MKTLIVYFSGTGNNLYVAKTMASQLGESLVLPIRKLIEGAYSKEIKDYQRIVFCVPAYHSHMPRYVADVLEQVHFETEQKIYTLLVCVGNRGHAVEDMREAIQKAGGKVKGEYLIMLPGSYILSYNAFPAFVGKIENQWAERKIRQIIKAMNSDTAHLIRHPGFLYKVAREKMLQEAIANYANIGSNFEVSEACIGCGTCEKVCPVKNIHMIDKRPVFEGNCQQCVGCVQWCPKHAIDYEHKAKKRKRYHHQGITVNDMIEGNK